MVAGVVEGQLMGEMLQLGLQSMVMETVLEGVVL
jgi:hypothetical protein